MTHVLLVLVWLLWALTLGAVAIGLEFHAGGLTWRMGPKRGWIHTGVMEFRAE